MTTISILVLGASGNAGRQISKLLLMHTDANVTLAGRNVDKLRELATELDCAPRVSVRQVDASSKSSLDEAFQSVDWVVVASSTTQYASCVIEAAAKAKIHYFDIQPCSTEKQEALKAACPERDGLCFITDGGYHPGLPAAMVRYSGLQRQPEEFTEAQFYILVHADWSSFTVREETLDEFVKEVVSSRQDIYTDGQWVQPEWKDMMIPFDFGPPYGKHSCVSMYLDELSGLTQDCPALQDLKLYIAGFNRVTDLIVLPLAMILTKCNFPIRWISRLFLWSLQKFSGPPYGNKIVLQTWSKDTTSPITHVVEHEDSYYLTAAPAVACLMQLLGSPKPGVYQQAHVVEPKKFFLDLKEMGIEIKETSSLDTKKQQ